MVRYKRSLGRRVRNLLTKKYVTAKAYHFCKFYLHSWRSTMPLVVYQMGKVGSSTIVASLKSNPKIQHPIFHVHVLTPEAIRQLEQEYYGQHVRNLQQEFLPRSRHILESQYLRWQIDRGLNGDRWKVVTLVREPVAQSVSSFFQTIDLSMTDFNERIDKGSISSSELIASFLTEVDFHEAPLRWLNTQLKSVFDVDVFATDFPKSKGFKIYSCNHADVLLLRLESLNECVQEAFKEFLGIDQFTLIKANHSSEKIYHSIYQEFISSLVLPKPYLDHVYDSKYTQHFYTADEICAFRAKWSTNSAWAVKGNIN